MVVLPSWQGLGLGPALSDLSASLWTVTSHGDETKTSRPCWRYSSTTAHPRFGSYRESNDEWKPTATNGKDGMFSHEYVGRAQVAVKRRIPVLGSTIKKRPFSDQSVAAIAMIPATTQSAPSVAHGALSPAVSATGSSLQHAIIVD